MSRRQPPHVHDMYVHRQELEQQVQEQFAFLVREKGFTLARTDHTHVQSTGIDYIHPPADLGLRVELDYRDEAVTVLLLRLREGALPPFSLVDQATGERIAVGFLLTLKNTLRVQAAGIDALYDALFMSVDPVRDHRWAEAILAQYRELVERYIDLVMQQPMDVLFSPPPPPPGASAAS